jgi:hypothetical protein
MQKMKKAQMLQFLFYTILALVIFIPTISWASQFFKLGDKSLKSFNQLSGLINNIEDGKINSMALYLDSETLIFGISKNAERIESYTFSSEKIIREGEKIIRYIFNLEDELPNGYIEKPPTCKQDKSCLCICREGHFLDDDKIICKDKALCNSFENIKFFENRPVNDISKQSGTITFNGLWKNGVIITNTKNKDLILKIYSVPPPIKFTFYNPTTVYVQRYKDFVNVCYDKNCITKGMIDDLNKEDAIKEFNIFKENYFKCKIKEDGYCNTFSIVLPERYYLYYITKQDLTDIMSVGNVGKIFLIHTENTDLEYIKDNLKDLKVKDNKDKEIHIDGKIFKDVDPKQEYDSGLLDDFAAYEMKVKDKEIIFNQI